MSKQVTEKTDEHKKRIAEQRAQWQSVIYGETANNIKKFDRQISQHGRIKTWW